jgi:hypothetical protein
MHRTRNIGIPGLVLRTTPERGTQKHFILKIIGRNSPIKPIQRFS